MLANLKILKMVCIYEGGQLFEARSVGQALARADQRPTIPS
jgi:hypothetical protein